MENAEVIDIDELLGDEPKQSLEGAEEYDFEGFLDDFGSGRSKSSPNPEPAKKDLQRNKKDKNHGLESIGNNISKSSRQDGSQPKSKSKTSNHSNSEDTMLSSKQPGGRGGPMDGTMTPSTQQEAMLDVLGVNSHQKNSQGSEVSEEDLMFDVNSEELKQFILEFQEESTRSVSSDSSLDVRTRDQGLHQGPRGLDDDSLSSLSTCESHDGSLSSSLASGDYHVNPDRIKSAKGAKGKSVRGLVSNLLTKNRSQEQEMLGSEDETNKKNIKKNKIKGAKKKDEKDKSPLSPRSARKELKTSNSTDKLRQILGEGDWEKKLEVNGVENTTSMQHEGTADAVSSPRESSLPKQVLQAAIKGDQQILEFLLLSKRELSVVRDGRGNTLLHTVCKRGHLDCLKWLATGFCSGLLTMENDDCFTPADLAVKHGYLECVGWLVQETDSKSELHPQDNRWSLLHVAARFGQEQCLRWLLGHMQVADIPLELIDHNDNTPAHLAAKYGHLTCLQTLVEFNADITMVNKKKQTPCILATKYHHDTCAQFLVVVETCVTLSEQVITLQRQLRESHEDRRVLKHKLKDTLSCTEALVKMHKTTDTLERIQQVRQEYVGLTNMLVRSLDEIHLEQKASEDENSDKAAETLDKVTESKRKAAELEKACQDLIEEEENRQQGDHSNRIQEIEDQLGRIVIPKSPRASWAPSTLDDPTHTLAHMRARLSEVSHGLAMQGPSLSEESMDNLSLSSSYASSLSSSCSSLTTLNRTNGSLRGSRRRKVTWTNEVGQTGEVVSVMTGVASRNQPDFGLGKTSYRPNLQRQFSTMGRAPPSPDSESTSSPTSPGIQHFVQYNRTLRRHKTEDHWSSSESLQSDSKWIKESVPRLRDPTNKAKFNCENGHRNLNSDSVDGKCDVAMATKQSHGVVKGDGVDLLESSHNPDKHIYVNLLQSKTESLPSKDCYPIRGIPQTNPPRIVQRTQSESDVSDINKLSVRATSSTKLTTKSMSIDGVQHQRGRQPPPEQFKKGTSAESVGEGSGNMFSDSSEDENDPFGSQNVLAMQEAMKNLRPIPIVEKIGNSTENLHQLFAKHLPAHKYNMVKNSGSETARNGQKTQMYEKVSTTGVNNTSGEDKTVVSQTAFDKRGLTLRRSNSDDSSVSSTSSTATWSENDQSESPRPRNGILNTGKKSGDGKKSRSDKHITFALDTDLGDEDDKNMPSRKIGIAKRRDLSPIYETPDLLRLSRNGNSALRQNIQETARMSEKVNDGSNGDQNGSGKTLEERLYRLFSYSSDDDTESTYSEESGNGGGHVARKDQYRPGMKIPSGLSNDISAEFEGISDDQTPPETNGPRMWYESSDEDGEEEGEEEEDKGDGQHSAPDFNDGHICYL